ncbi:hypothetical protein PROFUN_02012 [Planoprotostelium fungivorum]|uniref:glycerol kinase n=1 Tax=Planoprotostelium fungivorum TaxID=1890364 RepID=A0A2P6NB49_9EUKA|nr:hypothetical protein PROFUN_02012 [Planoprotostelium fungivorum]
MLAWGDDSTAGIIVIDAGTTSIRCHLWDRKGNLKKTSSRAVQHSFPAAGHVEQGLTEATAIGITSQRSCCVLWNRETGEAITPILSWKDSRASEHIEKINRSTSMRMLRSTASLLHLFTRSDHFAAGARLKLNNTLAACRLSWLLKNNANAKKLASEGKLCFGTIISWIIFKLTGGAVHATDTSDISVTGLWDSFSMKYNDFLLWQMEISPSVLPKVFDSSSSFGDFKTEDIGLPPRIIPISSACGDQQAALFGNCCFEEGDVKLTVGTGAFVTLNTGQRCRYSPHGLYPEIAWSFGGKNVFLMEAVEHNCGGAIQWAANLKMIDDIGSSSTIAESVSDAGGVVFVPALTGLLHPWLDDHAAGSFQGLRMSTTREHIVRAVLEGVAMRLVELVETVQKDENLMMKSVLRVDGGVSRNDFIMQYLSDMTGLRLEIEEQVETTSLGCAFLAGLHNGLWKSQDELSALRKVRRIISSRPIDPEIEKERRRSWNEAVKRSLGWNNRMTETQGQLRVSLSGMKPPDLSVINTEFLGYGFNILDGRIKVQIFDSMNVEYQKEMNPNSTELVTRNNHFKTYIDYERELCIRTGLAPEDSCAGMWTLCHLSASTTNGVITEHYCNTISRTRSSTRTSSELGFGLFGKKLSSAGSSDHIGKGPSARNIFPQLTEEQSTSAPNLNDHDIQFEESSERSRTTSIESSGSGITRSRSGSVATTQFYNQRLIFPFLTGIEKLDEYQHFVYEVEQAMYKLSIKELRGLNVGNPSSGPHAQLPPGETFHTALSSKIQREEDRIINMYHQQNRANGKAPNSDFSFRDETKAGYYQLIERIGTHFVSSLTYGRKAEYRWSLQDKQAKDAISKITAQQKYRKRFTNAVNLWMNEELNGEANGDSSELKKVKLPKHCAEAMGMTPNWYFKTPEDKMSTARPFDFKLERISVLFPVKAAGRISRSDMELAIEVYLEEMKPIRDVNNVRDGSVISIFSPDTGSFVELTSQGHLVLKLHVNSTSNRCAPGSNIPAECQFEVKKKGNKIGLKSMRWNKKFVSRAMTKSSFHFHRLQFMGPHESFELTGEYMQTGGTLSGATFLSCNPTSSAVEATIHHDGSFRKKIRLVVLDPSARQSKTEEGSEEPVYEEDDTPVQLSITITDGSAPISRKEEESKISQEGVVKMVAPASDPLTPFKIPSGIVHVIPAHLKAAKANSTSSLFVKDTILLPNIDQLTKGMAGCIRVLIEEGHRSRDTDLLDIFSEEKYPLTRQNFNFSTVPSVETIYHFLNTIFKVEKLPAEPGIMCLIYMRRLITKAKLKLHASNWRRVSLSALILASKVWEDQAVWNVDFIELFPNVTVQDLNRLEKYILKILEFNVSIKSSEYVKIYFELREYTDHIDARDPSTRPLGETGLQQLEIRTASSERALTMKEVKKTNSLALIDKGKKNVGARGVLS